MRRPVDAERIRGFMRELGEEAERDLRLYFTGGATAVLLGWRSSTLDVDIKVDPESDQIFRALPRVKEKLEINIELAAPDQFIPAVPDGRSGAPSSRGRAASPSITTTSTPRRCPRSSGAMSRIGETYARCSTAG